jgi:hypothetical protein
VCVIKAADVGNVGGKVLWSGSLRICGQTKKRSRYKQGQGTQEQPGCAPGFGELMGEQSFLHQFQI